jgi:hypothetical protein
MGDEMSRERSMDGEKKNAYRNLAGKPKGKRPLETSTHTWVNNIKMNLRYIKWVGMDWIDPTRDADQWRTP